jgi:hypothetical protein
MGCAGGRESSFVSNSTPFYIQIKIHKDKEVIDSFKKKGEFHAGITAGEEGVASLEVGGSYLDQKKGKINYVDMNFEGFQKISPNCTSDITSSVSLGVENYVSVYIMDLGSSEVIELYKNFEIKNDVRLMIGYLDEGKLDGKYTFEPQFFEVVEVNPKDKWRALAMRSSQNYYYKRCCLKCKGKEKCKANCPLAIEYEDYMEPEYLNNQIVINEVNIINVQSINKNKKI